MTVSGSSSDGSVRGLARGSSEVTLSPWTHTRRFSGVGELWAPKTPWGKRDLSEQLSLRPWAGRDRRPSLGDRAGERAPKPQGVSWLGILLPHWGFGPAKGECGQQPAGRGAGSLAVLGGPAPTAAAEPWRQLLHLPFSLSALVWPEDDRECDTARASEPLPVGRPRRLPPPGQGSATAVTRAFFPGLFDDQKGETKQECLTSECHGWVCGSVQPAGSERPRPNQLQIKQGFERVFGP